MKLLNLAKRLFLLPIGGLLVVHIGGCGGGASSKIRGPLWTHPSMELTTVQHPD